jgi:hypothetical protein
VKDIAESRYNIPFSINALTRIFDFPRFPVQVALAHKPDEPGQRGKHIALDQDCEEEIVDWIQQNAEKDTSLTREEILGYCRSQFKIKSTRRWINSFVLRHSDELIETMSCPQEGQRSQVSRAFPERIIQDLHNYVQGCVAELVFNLDEVGISDWEDRKTKKVTVPAAMPGQTIHYGVSRNVKHISMIACMWLLENHFSIIY